MMASSVEQARALDAADGKIDGYYHGNKVCARPPPLCIASGYPEAHTPPLGRGPPPPEWGCAPGRTRRRARAVAPLRVDLTQKSEVGTFRGLRWCSLPRERRGGGEVRIGQAEAEGGHERVRGRWAPPHAEGQGSTEGQW